MKPRAVTGLLLGILLVAVLTAGAALGASGTVSKSPGNTRFTVYYFHGTFRCPTCLKIEQLSARTVKAAFEEQIAKGFLEWKAVDIDQPDNKHFSSEFDLSSPTLVVARSESGTIRTFKKLEEVWKLVEGDERAFESYVLEEINRFISK